jgi:hypothetical protein
MNATRASALVFAAVLTAVTASSASAATTVQAPAETTAASTLHEYYGTVRNVNGTTLYLTLRTGRVLVVDASRALADKHSVLLTTTRPIIVRGTLGTNGVFHASVILRSHSMPEYWPPDH